MHIYFISTKQPLKPFIKSGIFLSQIVKICWVSLLDLIVNGFQVFSSVALGSEKSWSQIFLCFFSEVECGDRWLSTKTRDRNSVFAQSSENVSWPCSASRFNLVAEIIVGIVHFLQNNGYADTDCLIDLLYFSFQFHLVWQCWCS